METPNTSETLIEGLSASTQGGNANLADKMSNSFDLGEEKCTEPVTVSPPVAGDDLSNHADNVNMKGISLFVELNGHHLEEHETSKGNQGEILAAYKQCGVNVGDLVWAMIRKQSWWPGVVCEASSVQIRENGILVKCFGNGNYVWCHPDELKPLIHHFEELSSQKRTSKIFCGAINDVVAEVSNRVKKEFTCSCFTKMVEERRCDLDDLSLTQFDPATFYEYVKDLAVDVSNPNKIDYAINQSFLSAFNRSLGHSQIPIHQLRPCSSPSKIIIKTEENCLNMEDGIEGNNGKSEKGYETRERRKSRFLSYPGEQEMKELNEDGKKGMELNNKSNEGMELKKSRKRNPRKKVVVKQELPVNGCLCSSEVISELQSAAQDCGFSNESKNFDSVQRFIAGFRKWVFSDSGNGIKTGMQTPESEKPKRVRKYKKKKNKSGSLILDFQNADSVVCEATQGVESNNTIFKFKDPQMTKPPLRKLLPKKSLNNVDKNTPAQSWNSSPTPLPNVNGNMNMVPFLYHPMEASNQAMFDFRSTQPWLINHGQQQVNHEPKKRGRKRKHVEFKAHNGFTVTQPNGGEKKKGKIGKKKEETGVPCIDLTYNKVNQENLEVKGTAFLLKFSSQHPLPTTQILNSVFSKYGELNESETCTSIENLSGQVVFSDSSSAGGAFWGLQNDQPFGPALVNYRIQHLNNTQKPIEFKTPITTPVVKGQNGKLDTTTPGVVGSYMIPDLNGYAAAETQSLKKTEEIRLPSMKLQNGNNRVSGTALVLKFSSRHRVPSSQDLNAVFCKYGVNESETWVAGQDLAGQVVFVNPLRVGEAVENLEKERPFGEAVVSFRVQHLYNVKPAIPDPVLADPVKKPKLDQSQETVVQDIGAIRKNLEMMRGMLEKGGGNLTHEMRGKLESEILGLMNKVSGMEGGCCSSSSL